MGTAALGCPAVAITRERGPSELRMRNWDSGLESEQVRRTAGGGLSPHDQLEDDYFLIEELTNHKNFTGLSPVLMFE